MNNKRSPIEQFLLISLLAFAAFTLSQQFFGPKKTGVTPRPAPTLSKAFSDLNAGGAKSGGLKGGKEAALAEVARLQKEIEANDHDEYAAWAHLRAGLLQQYILRNSTEAREEYEAVINRHQHKEVDAQALYQKGDLLWRQAEQGSGTSTSGAGTSGADKSTALNANQISTLKADAVYALEQIPLRGRGDQAFLQTKIYVPDTASYRGDPLDLPQRWEQLTLAALRGDLNSPDPRGVLSRVDAYYSHTPLHQLFDTVVKWFGAQPSYSYGLALILLAVVTRVLMQPLIKKQYDSMKGMSLIAPEMKKIQDKYKGKSDQASQMKMMQEIRALQKAHGVNPMGCGLSMLIQMPVFFFFVLPLINHYQAKLELANAHFGWVRSLAHPDIPLLILYAISMFVSVRLSATPPADEQQRQMQKITTLMSPLFAVVLWSYPSAFILYWLLYNVVSMFFQWRMMKKSEPEKNLIKTLMGTGQPALALAGAASTPETGGALPARPGSASEKTRNEASTGSKHKSSKNEASKNEASKNEAAKISSSKSLDSFENNGAAMESVAKGSSNGALENHTAKSHSTKAGSSGGSGSQRARRRRR